MRLIVELLQPGDFPFENDHSFLEESQFPKVGVNLFLLVCCIRGRLLNRMELELKLFLASLKYASFLLQISYQQTKVVDSLYVVLLLELENVVLGVL